MNMADRIKEPFMKQGEKIYTGLDFAKVLESAGVKEGDTICVQSQLYSFGKSLLKKEDFLGMMIYVLQYVIGIKGTLLMPSFSYSFCKGEEYNVQQTPSDVGILTEYFRQMPDVYRTEHPIFSFDLGKTCE